MFEILLNIEILGFWRYVAGEKRGKWFPWQARMSNMLKGFNSMPAVHEKLEVPGAGQNSWQPRMSQMLKGVKPPTVVLLLRRYSTTILL